MSVRVDSRLRGNDGARFNGFSRLNTVDFGYKTGSQGMQFFEINDSNIANKYVGFKRIYLKN
jgi:hypothetical protein